MTFSILLVPIILLLRFVDKKRYQKFLAKPWKINTINFVFSVENFLVSEVKYNGQESTYESNYKIITSVKERKNDILLGVGRFQYIQVFKKDITQGTIEEFRELLKTKVDLKWIIFL